MEKYRFMSREWIGMAREEISRALADEDLGSVRFTLCEEFTDPPDDLRRADARTIGFFVRVADGRLEVGDHPIDDADVTIVSDYDDALAVARDPDAAAADAGEMQARIAAGRLEIKGDPGSAPRALAELDLHRLLAAQTS